MITNFEIFEKYKYALPDEKIVISFIKELNTIIGIVNSDFYLNIFSIKKYYNNSVNIYDFNINAFDKKILSIQISEDIYNKIFFSLYKKTDTIYSKEYEYNIIINYIKNFLIHDYLSIILNLYINHYDKLTDVIENNINDKVVKLILNKGLPKDIQDKYEYFSNANNFDLI